MTEAYGPDDIARLIAENARLRAALQAIIEATRSDIPHDEAADKASEIAGNALTHPLRTRLEKLLGIP